MFGSRGSISDYLFVICMRFSYFDQVMAASPDLEYSKLPSGGESFTSSWERPDGATNFKWEGDEPVVVIHPIACDRLSKTIHTPDP